MSFLDEKQSTPLKSSGFKKFVKFSLTSLAIIGYTLYIHDFSFTHTPSIKEIPENPYGNVELLRPENSDKAKFIYSDPEFRNASLKKFQGAVQIPTEVFDFATRPENDLTGWEPFLDLHKYFETTFPLVHKHLKLEKVNKLGLIYTWEGSNPELGPLVLTAHQDVVPVEEDTVDQWKYDPFSAHFDGTFVWGRGASDTKNLLLGIFESFEELLKDGFVPKRTIILSSAYDEEAIGRYEGAKSLSKVLEDTYGSKNIYALVDEGGGVSRYGNSVIASPGIAEKGYADLYIELKVPGGHSSQPPDHTAIGIIGELTTAIEADPYEPDLVDENPLLHLLRTIGETSETLPQDVKHDLTHARYDSGARERVVERLSKDKGFKYLLRTSQAIDIVQAGIKINALPEVLNLGINHRIAHGTTAQDIIDRVVSHVAAIAEKHNLGLHLQNGTVLSESTASGFFNVSWVQALDPSPVSSTTSNAWDVLTGSIRHTFEDIVIPGEKVHFGPNVVGGYTDASRYWPLTDSVYRFIGSISKLSHPEATNAHAINEHVEFDRHIQTISFLYDFIQNVDQYGS